MPKRLTYNRRPGQQMAIFGGENECVQNTAAVLLDILTLNPCLGKRLTKPDVGAAEVSSTMAIPIPIKAMKKTCNHPLSKLTALMKAVGNDVGLVL